VLLRQAQVHLPPPCVLKTFSLAWCIRWYELIAKTIPALPSLNLITFLDHPFYKGFLMLSLALEKQNVLFLQNMTWQKWMGCFFENKTWWWIHHGRDGFNIGKDVPLPGTKLWVEMIKLRPGGWLAREGSLGVVSPSESIKDRVDVGLMTEDPLTGHMPHHG
jgi:hypothetical protein